MKSRLYIYTSLFPFGKSAEAFLESEILFASEYFESVTLVPIGKVQDIRPIPYGVVLDSSLATRSLWMNIRAFLALFSRRVFWGICNERPHSLKEWKDVLKYCYAANLVYFDLLKKIQETSCPMTLYSYWLSYPPIAFSWIKRKYPKRSICCISRAHGSDIYSTEVGVYLPNRHLVMNNLDAIFTVSDFGKTYLTKKYGEQIKIQVSRLGVRDNCPQLTKQDNETLSIVSCSSVLPLKRVNLLFDSLNGYAKRHPERGVIWTHIGGGPLLEDLKRTSSFHQQNLSVILTGALNNKDILALYRENYYDCYILLSASEGIPVSIMEALSSGIPVISTNVGGVSEIVTKETGYLLDKDFSQDEFDAALDGIVSNSSLRESSYYFFKREYEAETNYRDFYQRVTNILNI